MGARKPFAAVLLCCFLVVAAAMPAEHVEPAQDGAISTYIVHVASSHSPRATRNTARLTRSYTSFLRDTLPTGIREPAPSILYAYAHAMTGFAARLTARQAAHLEAQRSVLAITPDGLRELHTTLSSSFLGLTPSSPLIMESNNATDIVIGVIDTGIYPKDRPSFAADPAMKPPSRFRGGCVSTPDFDATEYCNNKLVGAKFFHKGHRALISHLNVSAPAYGSPLDYDGHGTHCASIAAGAPVSDASFFDFGLGIAKGAASGARIASYKVCPTGAKCTDSDILAGIDEAIADKVDVLSISLGSPHSFVPLHRDSVSIGTFRAVRKGIIVSTAAGNEGPERKTVVNVAPWVLTVGASHMNRYFPAPVSLGNGESYWGFSLYNGYDPYGTMKPLIYGGDAGSARCIDGELQPNKVAGKIVFCESTEYSTIWQGDAVKQAGGVGAIISGRKDYYGYAQAEPHLLPAVLVTYEDAMEIKEYSRTPSPVASIKDFSQHIGPDPPSPKVASFSSRGPSREAPEILKPDVVAPGVEILAAWTGETSPTGLYIDTRRVKFNIISGTSMAAPHVSGIAAMLKVARPEWSPAEIKSALMTTAYNVDNTGGAITDMSTGRKAGPFELGAGHVDPNRALDPGLVYDAGEDDYISFLCGLGYTPRQIAIFTRSTKSDVCVEHKYVGDHNYPAFSVAFKSYQQKAKQQRRVVRNVGSNVDAVYTFHLREDFENVDVSVYPTKLVFDAQHQTLEYTLIFRSLLSAANNSSPREEYSAIVLSDGQHEVVSPIVVTWPAPTGAVAMM